MSTDTLTQSSTERLTEKHPLHAEVEAAYNEGDIKRWISCYGENAVLRSGSAVGGLAIGRQQIGKILEGLIGLRGSLAAETVYAVKADDHMLLRGKFKLSYIDEGGELQEMIAHTVEVAKRGSDGQWRFIIDHASGADQLE
jgi:ketosteroid isomerase-like protein